MLIICQEQICDAKRHTKKGSRKSITAVYEAEQWRLFNVIQIELNISGLSVDVLVFFGVPQKKIISFLAPS